MENTASYKKSEPDVSGRQQSFVYNTLYFHVCACVVDMHTFTGSPGYFKKRE